MRLTVDNQDFLERNLSSIESVYPGLAKYLRARSNSLPTDHHEQASFELDQQWNPNAALHVVDRFSSTPMAHQLFDRINLAEFSNTLGRRLLLLEDRPERFLESLRCEDWRPLIESEKCLLAVGEEKHDSFKRLLERYPHIAFSDFQIYSGDACQPQDRCRTIEESLIQSRDTVCRALEELNAARQRTTKPPFPNTLRFFAPGHNFLQDACVNSLRDMGYDAGRLQWKNPLYPFIRSSAWLHEIHDRSVDTAILLNATPATFTRNQYLSQLPVHRVSWFVDNPLRYALSEQDYKGCDLIAVFDPTYIPYIPAKDAKVVEIRTGFGVDVGNAVKNDDFSTIDVAFVGEFGMRGVSVLEQGFLQLNPTIVETASELLREYDITRPEIMIPAAQSAFSKNGIEYHGTLVEYLENKATSLRRRYFLEALVDRGLVIFGDSEWQDTNFSGPLASCYSGRRLQYATELPALYASTKININLFHVQCVAAPNPRVYDVLACGGFLLTTDNPGLDTEFKIGDDLVVFRSKDELRDQVNYYLAHPEERARIAKNGQARALANCGYHNRMQRLLSHLSQDTGDRYAYLCG